MVRGSPRMPEDDLLKELNIQLATPAGYAILYHSLYRRRL